MHLVVLTYLLAFLIMLFKNAQLPQIPPFTHTHIQFFLVVGPLIVGYPQLAFEFHNYVFSSLSLNIKIKFVFPQWGGGESTLRGSTTFFCVCLPKRVCYFEVTFVINTNVSVVLLLLPSVHLWQTNLQNLVVMSFSPDPHTRLQNIEVRLINSVCNIKEN